MKSTNRESAYRIYKVVQDAVMDLCEFVYQNLDQGKRVKVETDAVK